MPASHPLRQELNDEVHARPPVALDGAQRLSYIALLSTPDEQRAQWTHLVELCRREGHDAPSAPPPYITLAFRRYSLVYERHSEFTRLTFMAKADGAPFERPAIALVPADWLEALPGQMLLATHVALVAAQDVAQANDTISNEYFAGNVLVGATVSEGAAVAMTDYRIHADGFSRILVRNLRATPRQAGRIVQRLLEIDTYRMMALLAFPVARRLAPDLAAGERELSSVAEAMSAAPHEAEAPLLDRLMRLAAEIEARYVDNQYRFSAAAAYYDLVQRRIRDLREERLDGMQTIGEFMERRLAPAMATSRATARRVDALAERVSLTTQLLSTRIDVVREEQNQKLLTTMARRAKLQLRLQQTVEGLSVAAITYYVVGLVGYAAKGLYAMSVPISPELTTALSIPLVIAAIIFGVRRIRRALGLEGD